MKNSVAIPHCQSTILFQKKRKRVLLENGANTFAGWQGCHKPSICGGGIVAKSFPTLVIPWTVTHQAPPSMGFSRQEYWSGLPFPSPGGSSWPRDWTQISWAAGRFFTNRATWESIFKNKQQQQQQQQKQYLQSTLKCNKMRYAYVQISYMILYKFQKANSSPLLRRRK